MHSHPLLWDSRADSFLHDCFDADLHKRTLRSVRDAVLGTLASARAGVAHIGRGLAQARGLRPKHAIKQVDRLLSNHLLDLEALAPSWLAFVVGNRTDIVIAFDWTDFAKDDQSFTIEERFRDIKDWRFGMGVSAVRMANPHRRDRLLLIVALAQTLLQVCLLYTSPSPRD